MQLGNNIFDQNLKTERLLLRRLLISDVEDMFEYTSDARVTKYLEWSHHIEIDQARYFITKILKEYDNEKHAFLWAIELVSDAKMIGVIRIYDYSPQNKRAEISYILNPAYQGKGYIGEAIGIFLNYCFNNLDITRIQAKCSTDNIASEKVMQKVGMHHEGIMRKYFYIDGLIKDALLYAVTDESYKDRFNNY